MKKLLFLCTIIMFGSVLIAQVPPKDKEMYDRLQKEKKMALVNQNEELSEKEIALLLAKPHSYTLVTFVSTPSGEITDIIFNDEIESNATSSQSKEDSKNMMKALSSLKSSALGKSLSIQTSLNQLALNGYMIVAQSAVFIEDEIHHFYTLREKPKPIN